MTDKYLDLVNSGPTALIAKKLGLPRPAVLRRETPGAPLVPGPVLVVADGASAADSDVVAKTLLAWDLDVRRHPAPGDRLGAVVVVLTGLERPGDLAEPALALGSHLRDLARGARVVTLSRPAAPTDTPEVAAARGAVEGFGRSVAKELRGGATANGILLAEGADPGAPGVGPDAPSVTGALRFFLSGASAFVDGQFLEVSTSGGTLPPGEWTRPLEGKVAVVTGAARGIGAAIARRLAADGAHLVVVDVPAAGESLAMVANRVRGTALHLDITAEGAGTRMADLAASRYGRLDIVIHNAGITRDKLLANMSAEKWNAVLAVNLESHLRINAELMDGRLAEGGRIVALSSTSGIAGNRGQTNYGASKAGVIGWVQATAGLLAPRGATANAVAPGFIETDMTAAIPPIPRQVMRRASSLQQGGRPEDVAAAVAFLASPAAGGISGQVLRVCGQNMVGR